MTLSIDWAGVVLLRRVFSFVGVIVILSACSVSVRASDSLFDLLDLEGDGALGRYEAMAEWLKLVEEADLNDDGKVTRQELQKFQRERQSDQNEEYRDLLEEFDENEDRRLSVKELPEEFRGAARRADSDRDGFITAVEFGTVHITPRDLMRGEVESMLEEVDQNGDGKISKDEVPREHLEDFYEADTSKNGEVTFDELLDWFAQEEASAQFSIKNDVANMTGVIDGTTPARVLELAIENPQVRMVVLQDVPGSIDDDACLFAGSLLRNFGFKTHVPSGGTIASGGVDFFLAGAERTVEAGSRIGVHSWGGPDGEGRDLPRDDEAHTMYLDFYREMGIPSDFYWFTLGAASEDDIHWMTQKELNRFRCTTKPAPKMGGQRDRDREDSSRGELKRVPEFLASLDPSTAPRGILPLPERAPSILRRTFDRYSRVTAPNGEPIHILAQSGWREDQIVRARRVLEHMLTDVPGSRYGASKKKLANTMADRRATLALFDDEPALERALRGPFGEVRLRFQDLRANECPVEGDPDYLAHETRDAAFEEILHLVHDQGIRPVLREFDRELEAAQLAAKKAKRWKPWPRFEPDSHRNEYFAAAYDNYLDLWTVSPTKYEGEEIPPGEIPKGTSHFGAFKASSRETLRESDLVGFELVESFLPSYLTYTADLPISFEGVFSISFDPKKRYTTKSQHLRNVRLRGNKSSSLIGNDGDNVLTGNPGDNVLQGRGGTDLLIGGAGRDVAVFRGVFKDYSVVSEAKEIIVTDRIPNRDGVTRLRGIEVLRFNDREESLKPS